MGGFGKALIFVFLITQLHSVAMAIEASDIVDESSKAFSGVDFNRLQGDIDEDGTIDNVICNNTEVKIVSGKDKKVLYRWDVASEKHGTINGLKREIPNCSVVSLKNNSKKVLIVSTFWIRPSGSWDKFASSQFAIFSNGSKLVRKAIVSTSGESYKPVARSVKCINYPKTLVNSGFNPGAICFFAGYRQHFDNADRSRTALLKLEMSGGKVVFKDLSTKSGFPWNKGVAGTPVFRWFPDCNNLYRADGINTMDGAFVKTDDSLSTLITVGQHAHMRATKIKIDRGLSEGLSFSTTIAASAQCGTDTEYLTSTSFQEMNNDVDLPCAYITGEVGQNEGGAFINTYDHLRCYQNGKWDKIELPKTFSSGMRRAPITQNSNKVIIKTGKTDKNGAWKTFQFTIKRD